MTPARSKPLILGNWKMNLTAGETTAHLSALLPRLETASAAHEIAVAPPFTSLPAAAALLRGSRIGLAAQNLSFEDEGPYTGEISGEMLQELGVRYVLVGHSERRQHLGETDRMVSQKVRAALRSDLTPVVCVGEQEAARASGRAATVVRTQLLRALEGLARGDAERVVVAYEPVWAIGTGRAASASDADEMQAAIRTGLEKLVGGAAGSMRILYGGSVTPGNIDAFMACPGIGGALVGGASLRVDEFARIADFRRHS